MGRITPEQKHIARDAAVFAIKLWLDGLKDVALGFLALGAAVIDLIRGRQAGGFLFYKVLKLGHRIDSAIDVYGGSTPPPEELYGPREPRGGKRG